ncbi:MAG: (2Fe-2S)-binding protein [Pseudomonadota bacterium]|nr:(2Fe-2S)-binding protein [Pseudomonadota bacterium]
MESNAMEIGRKRMAFTLNGRAVEADVPSYWNLVDLLRDFDLFGARESCGIGACGCCTVLVDGTAMSGCLTLAQTVEGKAVTTVEDQDRDGTLSVVQQAFVDEAAFQCGFCTPGFVMMVGELLKENPEPSDDEVRSYLSGNLCRCATYPEILKAVRVAASRLRG